MLTPLTITDLSPHFKAPYAGFSLILIFEIVTRNERLTCKLKGVIIPEQRCLDEIQHVTQSDIDFPVQQDQKRTIIKNTTPGSTYIVMDNNKFRLTSSPFGTSACAGQIAVSTSDNLKRLHDHFFLKMADVFVHIFDIIELTAYRLSDTILTIATEESDTFMLTFNITNMDQEIIKLIPQILPNIAHANTEPTTFDLFFAKYVNTTQDLAFSRLKLTQTEIRLDSRKKAILYASLMQFTISVNKRLSALANAILNTTSEHEDFPGTLLFTADQSPYSFKSLVLNVLQISSEEILTKFFLIIQNQKNTLYQNVAGMLNIHHVPNHLSRANSALDRARKDSLEALIPVESIKKPLPKPKVSLKIKMLAYNATNNVLVQKRGPRSWGGFWGAAFSLATEEQLNKALQKEVELPDNELILSSSLFNMTITNAQMISSLKTLTTGVSKLVTEEQGIFRYNYGL
jgi:hypothetical protein